MQQAIDGRKFRYRCRRHTSYLSLRIMTIIRTYTQMKFRQFFTYIMLAGASVFVHAQGDGSTAYDFLNVTSSSLVYGLGGMNVSLVGGDINTIDQNPALLGAEMDNQVAFNYMRYLGDSNFAGLAYARSVGEHGAWAASVRYLGYGYMKETDVSGNIVGSFSASDVVFGGTFCYDITDRLRGGASLKLAYDSYAEYSAFAVATDLGINYYDPEKDLSLSLVVANLGGQVKRFDERYDRLPLDVRIGWSQSFASLPLRFSITAWNLTKWSLPYYDAGDGSSTDEMVRKDSFGSNLMRHLVFGIDYVGSDNFYIGLGYNYKTRTDMSTYSRSMLSGFSLAAGLNVRNFGIGIAFAQPHKGATTLMLNLSCNLNDFLE